MTKSETLAEQLGQLLLSNSVTVTTAESCTGGGIAQVITSVAGSSAWFTHGVVTYSNKAKTQLLGVAETTLVEQGAVSQAVVESMALGVAKLAQADYGIAVSGVAGPSGGSPEKPVGTVWIAWALPESAVSSQQYLFLGDRNSVRNQTVEAALSELVKIISKNTV
mgnify:CR=1 FL=1